MQDHETDSNPHGVGGDEIEVAERNIINCLLAESDHVWTQQELQRELSGSPLFLADALVGLERAGLININGDHILVSRAAVRMHRLKL
jgi:hypothetical protein